MTLVFEVSARSGRGSRSSTRARSTAPDEPLRRDLRARAVRPAPGVGRALARAARRGPRDRRVPRRVRPQVPARRRLLDQGAAEGGARAAGTLDWLRSATSERPRRPPARARRRRADPRLAQLGVDRDRAVPRGGRRLLLDRAERDRARAGAVRARRARARHRRRRARVRPAARGVPLRAARRAAPARVGADDRPPLALRDGRRDPARGAEGLRRRRGRRARGEDRPRGGYHRMHAEMWLDRLLATDEGRERLDEALDELWPYALGVLDDELRPELAAPGARSGSAGSCRRPSRCRAARTRPSSTELLGRDDDGAPLGAARARNGDRRARSGTRWRRSPIRRSRSSRSSTSACQGRRGRRTRACGSTSRRRSWAAPRSRRCSARWRRRSRELGAEPEVRVVLDDSWSTDRITPAGREKLRAAGFAPPAPRGGGRRRRSSSSSAGVPLPVLRLDATRSSRTSSARRRAARSATATSCRQPFEQFKTMKPAQPRLRCRGRCGTPLAGPGAGE